MIVFAHNRRAAGNDMANTKHERLLQDALLAAMSHIARLDDSIPTGVYRTPTTLLMWILRTRNPKLTFQIYQEELADRLTAILNEYIQLHQFSAQYVDGEYDPTPRPPLVRGVQLKHLEHALTKSNALVSQDFRSVFAKAALDITQRGVDSDLRQADRALLSQYRWPVQTARFDHQGSNRVSKFGINNQSSSNNVETAVNWVSRYLTRMDNGRDSNFWKTVDLAVVTQWLRQDKPGLTKAFLTENRLDEFGDATERLLDSNVNTETVWNALGHYLRTLLSIHTNRDLAIRIIKLVMSTMLDNMVEGVSAESVYSMFCARLRPPHRTETRTLYETNWSTTTINYLRTGAGFGNGCFLIDYKSLPKSLWDRSAERSCLAVTLPDDWLRHRDRLELDEGIHCFASRSQHGQCRSHISVNGSFWMNHDDALHALEHFRTELPVAYIFKRTIILALYRFNRFTDFAAIGRIQAECQDTYMLSDSDWTNAAAKQTVTRPDGSQLKPSIFEAVDTFRM